MESNLFNKKSLMFGTMGVREEKLTTQPNSLYSVLDYYGFKSRKQKDALLFVMQLAGISGAEKILNSKATNQNDLFRKILNFIKLTQKHFTIRSGTQERWQIKTASWMKNPKTQCEILDSLETLNMIQDVLPKLTHTDAICILGSSNVSIISRLGFASKLFKNNKLSAKQLILLAGERYITYNQDGYSIDGTKEELSKLSKKLGKATDKLTETDLILAAYNNSDLCGKLPITVVDTPRRNLPRPTTETTILELINKWLPKNPEIKKITFVSSQPHVKYQQDIISRLFKQQDINIDLEVIGGAGAYVSLSPDDKIKYIVGALGSHIWAISPDVLDSLDLNISDEDLKQEFIALYRKHPLIYSHLKSKLISKNKI